MSDDERTQTLEQLQLDTDGLYHEENFTDRRVGSIQRLTPVTRTAASTPAGLCCM